jgi:hypothetical protein
VHATFEHILPNLRKARISVRVSAEFYG